MSGHHHPVTNPLAFLVTLAKATGSQLIYSPQEPETVPMSRAVSSTMQMSPQKHKDGIEVSPPQ